MMKNVVLLFLLTTTTCFAQQSGEPSLLIGHWKLQHSGVKCPDFPEFSQERIDFPTFYLSFHDDFTHGRRSIQQSEATIDGFYGKWQINAEKKLLVGTEDFDRTLLKPIEIKKLNQKQLRIVSPITVNALGLDDAYTCKLISLYERVDDFSRILKITKVGDHWIENTEVLNAHWLEYETVQRMKMDSAAFLQANIQSPFKAYKDKREGLRPMTMITYEQAVAFCEWKSVYISQIIGQPVTYRLPTLQEWAEIATTLFEERKKKLELEQEENKKKLSSGKDPYMTLGSLLDEQEVVHLFDNVSEMTATEGKSTGASSASHLPIEDQLTRVDEYSKPDYYLGFRCIVEFEE